MPFLPPEKEAPIKETGRPLIGSLLEGGRAPVPPLPALEEAVQGVLFSHRGVLLHSGRRLTDFKSPRWFPRREGTSPILVVEIVATVLIQGASYETPRVREKIAMTPPPTAIATLDTLPSTAETSTGRRKEGIPAPRKTVTRPEVSTTSTIVTV